MGDPVYSPKHPNPYHGEYEARPLICWKPQTLNPKPNSAPSVSRSFAAAAVTAAISSGASMFRVKRLAIGPRM